MEEHTKWFCNQLVNNNSNMKRRCHSESDLQKSFKRDIIY